MLEIADDIRRITFPLPTAPRRGPIRSGTICNRSNGRSSSAHGSLHPETASRFGILLGERLDATAAALGERPWTAYEVSIPLFGDSLPPSQRRFAVAETLSHLERLVRDGRAVHAGDSRPVTYTAP